MRSKSVLFVLWIAGTVVAATVAWQSLGIVGASIDGGELASVDPVPTLPVPAAVPAADTSAVPSTTGPSTTGPSEVPSSTTEPLAAPPVSPETDPVSTSTTSSVPADAEVRVYELEGGTVAISFRPGLVEVLWYTPAVGYRAESEGGDGGVEVSFRNGAHRSKVEAWWSDGPHDQVRERAD